MAKKKKDSDARDLYLGLYRQMVLIRVFEERTHDLFLRGEVYGSTHLCIGQEAVSAGFMSALAPEDRVACTYRGHGHVIALGSSPYGLMAELLARADGTCGARAGSMNVVDLENRLIGCFGIVGGSLAAATGAALTLKRGSGVAVGVFGDGAANQAYFHECLNFAKVLSLPVVFLCENNQYGEFTPTDAVTPGGILARPRAMDIPAARVDGQDVWAVRAAAEEALATARSGGPAFVEAFTYRYSDHGRGDPYKYRPDGEMERWRERDPLLIARERLGSDYGVSEDELDAVVKSVEDEVDALAEKALAAPFPEPDPRATEYAA
ncbi:MAG: thiamine pyrophosphate-dependent dehydrogenase E1 component subunit alpha [Solirubrobacterales bacterium]